VQNIDGLAVPAFSRLLLALVGVLVRENGTRASPGGGRVAAILAAGGTGGNIVKARTNPTGGGKLDPRQAAGYLFAGAMVAAPFLALLFGWNAGLAVLAFALAATTFLTLDALRRAPSELRPRLRWLAALNGVLTLFAVVILVVRMLD
jgi:hypothetical protein